MNERILIIEDDQAILKLLQRGLAYEGYVDVAVGYSHQCAIRVDGGVDCWRNPAGSFTDFGQLDVPAELQFGSH